MGDGWGKEEAEGGNKGLVQTRSMLYEQWRGKRRAEAEKAGVGGMSSGLEH